jgi:formylglycine-generating enzyme required for sulfatase activity
LIERHSKHAATLDDVGRLTAAGQVETARRLIGTLQATFGDLDYSAREQRLAQLEKQLKSQSEKVDETKKGLQEFGREAGRFFAFPPIGLMRRGSVAQGTAEKVLAETAQIGKVGGNSEVDRMVSGWTTGLKSDLDSLQTLWMNRVRRWILGATVFWLVVLVAGGVTFQQFRAGQERERQRVVAEVKAKAEAEEREWQRLAAIAEQERLRLEVKAKAKAELEEKERQRLAVIAEQERLRLEAEMKAKVEVVKAQMASGGVFQAGEQLNLGLAVRWIPAGRFTMGSPGSEEERSSDETQHEVVLSHGFFMAEKECTQGQWEMVMESNPSIYKGANRPVERVSWSDAVEYCRKLTVKQRGEGMLPVGWEWRLPTEAEWEYAARAGATGARHGELDSIAWHSGNSGSETHAVGGKQANAWGLHDMMGNVWEWCSDWGEGYPTGSVTDPKGPSSGSFHVLRGGSCYSDAGFVRSALRNRDDPGVRLGNLSFRPVLSSVR